YTPSASASAQDVEINSIAELNKLKLTFNFTSNGREIVLNDSDVHTDLGVGAYVLQACKDGKFDFGMQEMLLPSKKGDNRVALNGRELYKFCKNIGNNMKDSTSTHPVYFRIGHFYTAANTSDGKYSDVMKVNVKSIYVDMSSVTVKAASDGAEVGHLYSPEDNEHYYGFINCPSDWYNFWIYDGLQVQYGILPNQYGTLETPSSGKEVYNFWTIEANGIFYYDIDVIKKEIITNYVKSVTANGVEMDLDQENVSYIATLDKTDVTIKITFVKYTSNDKAPQGEVEMYFCKNADGTLSLTKKESKITVDAAGEYVLSLGEKDYTFAPAK
ncbi:MAG: DUF5111 domain-containing protein, partial [Bacteroidales bacterium]|nr:DUF5111 domain-containing protein [Bacteroidales bacterium]